MDLCVVACLFVSTDFNLFVSKLIVVNLLEKSELIVLKECMVNNSLSLLLVQLCIDQERTLQKPLPNVIQGGLGGVLFHEIVPFFEHSEHFLCLWI